MAWVAASDADIEELRRAFSVMRVCPNKLVQLMHVDYLGDLTNVRSHMALHAQILQLDLLWLNVSSLRVWVSWILLPGRILMAAILFRLMVLKVLRKQS